MYCEPLPHSICPVSLVSVIVARWRGVWWNSRCGWWRQRQQQFGRYI